jgi:hypothetical protein
MVYPVLEDRKKYPGFKDESAILAAVKEAIRQLAEQ